MSTDNPGIKEDLRTFYDLDVGRRKEKEAPEWKIDHRSRFLNRCQESGGKRLLEVGSGPGRDGSYFADSGIDQVPIDLSVEMTRECSKEGLSPTQMDTYNLGFSENTFDCVGSLNVLLHVPKASIESVWQEIHQVMKPGAIFFWASTAASITKASTRTTGIVHVASSLGSPTKTFSSKFRASSIWSPLNRQKLAFPDSTSRL